MTRFKEVLIDEDTVIFITFYNNNIYAIGNVNNIIDKIEDEIDIYMKENNYKNINIITANDFDVYNIEK